MLKYVCSICFVFIAVTAFSQNGKELEFNVVKPKVKIGVKPNYKFLFQNLSHPIQIIISDTINNYVTKLAGGTINETDSGTFIIPEIDKEVILNVYELNEEKKETLIRSKKYHVLPEPEPYLRNKSTDNFLLEMLLVSGKLKGVTNYKGKKIISDVKSFTVVYRSKVGFKSVEVVGNNIPIVNREEISELPNGTLIYFEDIMIELIPGYETMIKPYRITMEVIDGRDVTKYR